MEQAKTFVNFTNKDFTFKWDGQSYLIKAGESRMMQSFLADHAAKHLTDQVLQSKNIRTDDLMARKSVLSKCFGEFKIEAPSKEKLEMEMLNLNEVTKKELIKVAKGKGIQIDPKANKATIQKAIEEGLKEEDFEGLED